MKTFPQGGRFAFQAPAPSPTPPHTYTHYFTPFIMFRDLSSLKDTSFDI